METGLEIANIEIPYGVLHDQILQKVVCRDNTMIFTFDVRLFPEDYNYGHDVYEKYLPYKHCDMIVEMSKEPWNSFLFETGVNKRGKFKGLCLNRADFLNIINDAFRATFVECSATYREFKIELSIDLHNFKGNRRKYKKYDMCYITLDAAKVSWNWY